MVKVACGSATPYVWKVLHFNKEGKPTSIIEGVKALDITFNEETGDLWVYGAFKDDEHFDGYIILYDREGKMKKKTPVSGYLTWCEIKMIDDGKVSLLLWEGEV
ncbi:MAG: hypothetical protein ACUVWP_05550 [bacterium]